MDVIFSKNRRGLHNFFNQSAAYCYEVGRVKISGACHAAWKQSFSITAKVWWRFAYTKKYPSVPDAQIYGVY